MSNRKNCGNRTHVGGRHWLSEIVETWVKHWDLPKFWYSACRFCHTSSSNAPQSCHTSFLCRCVLSDGTFPNLLMSLSWTLSFGDCSSQFMYDVLCDWIFLLQYLSPSVQGLPDAVHYRLLLQRRRYWSLLQGSLHDMHMCQETVWAICRQGG